jgi:hypothetical protein
MLKNGKKMAKTNFRQYSAEEIIANRSYRQICILLSQCNIIHLSTLSILSAGKIEN